VNLEDSALLSATTESGSTDSQVVSSPPLASPLPTLIGYWDLDMRNVTANDAHRDYFGMAPADLRGRHLSEVLVPADYELACPRMEAALQGAEQAFSPAPAVGPGAPRYTQESYIPDIVSGTVRGVYHYITDVTAQVEAENQRDEALRLFHVAMTNAPIGKAVLGASGHVLQANPALGDLLGYSVDEMIGTDFRRYVHRDDLASGEADLAALVDGTAKHVASERRYVRRDGTTVWVQRNAVLVPRAHGTEDVVVAQFQDIGNRRHAEAELARMVDTDALTGLNNRHALLSLMDSYRDEQVEDSLGVIFIDIDDFKDINDAHGHATGDEVLVQVGHRLAALVTRNMKAYRMGGDEFVVLDPSRSSAGHTADFARHIRLALTGIYDAGPTLTTVTASVGWTWGSSQHISELLRTADADMYRQKLKQRRRRTDLS
jgi:diguanylate cyclase (GGDEF)-like protein/PAS domain S-box-containing protein